jgi:hypothetical protein
MRGELDRAPDALAGKLPNVDDVMSALQANTLGPEIQHYLQRAFDVSTHYVYAGMVVAAVLTLLVVLLVPRHILASGTAPA